MLKNLLFLVVIVVSARAKLPIQDEFDEVALENFVKAFKTEVIDKEQLTCENYDELYCQGKGARDFENDEETCKIWTGNYLCKEATDIEGLKRTVQEINSRHE